MASTPGRNFKDIMNRSFFRRAGGAFLFLVWAQVATANALPCGINCLLGEEVAHHVHEGHGEDHAVGHHMAGAKISAPEFCGTPQLLVVTFVPPDFPVAPMTAVRLVSEPDILAVSLISAVPEFATPPPRA